MAKRCLGCSPKRTLDPPWGGGLSRGCAEPGALSGGTLPGPCSDGLGMGIGHLLSVGHSSSRPFCPLQRDFRLNPVPTKCFRGPQPIEEACEVGGLQPWLPFSTLGLSSCPRLAGVPHHGAGGLCPPSPTSLMLMSPRGASLTPHASSGSTPALAIAEGAVLSCYLLINLVPPTHAAGGRAVQMPSCSRHPTPALSTRL